MLTMIEEEPREDLQGKWIYLIYFYSLVQGSGGAYPLKDFADRFKVSTTTLSRIFTTWINLMFVKFRELQVFLLVAKWM